MNQPGAAARPHRGGAGPGAPTASPGATAVGIGLAVTPPSLHGANGVAITLKCESVDRILTQRLSRQAWRRGDS